jgi:germination protein M
MQKTKLLLTLTVCIAVIMLLVGCNVLSNLIKDDGGSAPLGNILNRNTDKSKDSSVVPVTSGSHQIKLYFADKSGKKLIEVDRTIPATLSLARETVNQWLLGPSGNLDSYPTVSPSTTLRDININNGVVTLDLSKEFLQPYNNVSPEVVLYGLVDTVSQFSTVQLIKIRVEGQDIKTFRGISLTDLKPRSDIIGTSSQTGGNTASETEKKESPSSMNIFVNN